MTNNAGRPIDPVGILDNASNTCHSGFLRVVKAIKGTIATQLELCRNRNRNRRKEPVLLFTCHLLRGPIASLLYMHMHSQQLVASLIALLESFEAIHCITFGVPPISHQPLTSPASSTGVFFFQLYPRVGSRPTTWKILLTCFIGPYAHGTGTGSQCRDEQASSRPVLEPIDIPEEARAMREQPMLAASVRRPKVACSTQCAQEWRTAHPPTRVWLPRR